MPGTQLLFCYPMIMISQFNSKVLLLLLMMIKSNTKNFDIIITFTTKIAFSNHMIIKFTNGWTKPTKTQSKNEVVC